jgi:hypothetical protein
MDIGFIKSWNKEIRYMNEGKVGAPFEYSQLHPFSSISKDGFMPLGDLYTIFT